MSACGTNAACGPSGDSGSPISGAEIPDGGWYSIVTAADIDGAGACCFFALSAKGSLPLALQAFTIT